MFCFLFINLNPPEIPLEKLKKIFILAKIKQKKFFFGLKETFFTLNTCTEAKIMRIKKDTEANISKRLIQAGRCGYYLLAYKYTFGIRTTTFYKMRCDMML